MARVEVYSDAIAELARDPEGEIAKDMERAAFSVENEAKALLLRPGSGRIYEPGSHYYRKGGKLYHWVRTLPAHQASAPGEPPSSDTGLLLNTLEHVMDEDAGGVFYRVGSREKVAEYLEQGTRLMEPRPFLRRALDVLKIEGNP